LQTKLDGQSCVKTISLKLLFNEAVNYKCYVLSVVERYLEEKIEMLKEKSFPKAMFSVINSA